MLTMLAKLVCGAFCLESMQGFGGENKPTPTLPVRGLCIGAPRPSGLERFVKFIGEELAPRGVNTLILRVDWNYQYESHPELRASGALSKADVGELVKICRKQQIRLIPQVNLLGHQSWANHPGNLLKTYPDFDETPWVKFPEKYKWPNDDRLYCKSYCPLHPQVHDVVFAVVDELCDVFEADAFHAGMDEVFYIGEDRCPRCGGKDKAQLFADEVKRIQEHLAQRKRQLWIWGDRLLDGKTTGLGEWEASLNDTYRAIDLIPKDVVICDWHYERPDPSAILFAMKGLSVVTCPWNRPRSGARQVENLVQTRQSTTPEIGNRLLGIVHTVWSGADSFLNEFYGLGNTPENEKGTSAARCFVKVFETISSMTPAATAK